MKNLQEVFELCSMLYEKCYNNVKEMSRGIAFYMESKGKEYDPSITVEKFDVVLQYSLLQVAVADYDFDINEMIFIRDLTKQGDFVNYINAIAKEDITWEELYKFNVHDIVELLRSMEGIMENLSDEFVNVFAICDIVTEYNYVADLEKNIILIFAGLTQMDGITTNSELNQECAILGAINRIKKLKK